MIAASGCPSVPTIPALELWVTEMALAIPWFLMIFIADAYPKIASTRQLRFIRVARRVSNVILALSGIVLGIIGLIDAFGTQCTGSGAPHHGGATGWIERWAASNTVISAVGAVGLLALFALVVGVAAGTAAEWLMIGYLAVLDVGVAATSLEAGGPHAVTVAILFGLHATYTGVGAWWSWRLRGAPPQHRAGASEAGRVLASGWLVMAVLFLAAAHDSAAAKSLFSDTQLVSILVITATSIAVGSGYTKYAQARAAHTTPPPESPVTPRWSETVSPAYSAT